MHTKAITVNLYTFHRNMSPIRRPFLGTDKASCSHTQHLRSGQTARPAFLSLSRSLSPPDPYLRPPRMMSSACSCYSFPARLISPFMMLPCWKNKCCRASGEYHGVCLVLQVKSLFDFVLLCRQLSFSTPPPPSPTNMYHVLIMSLVCSQQLCFNKLLSSYCLDLHPSRCDNHHRNGTP